MQNTNQNTPVKENKKKWEIQSIHKKLNLQKKNWSIVSQPIQQIKKQMDKHYQVENILHC